MFNQELPDFLQNQVEFFLKDKNLSNLKFHFSNACNNGENYLGSLYRVKINGEKNGENKELHLIIKCVPTDEKLRTLLRAPEMFHNEIAFYEERLPIINNLMKEFNLEYNDFPAYYGGCKTPKQEILILEDLKTQGFVLKKTKVLDYPHAVLAMRHLGRFHGYSFAIRDKKPAALETFQKMKEAFFHKSGCFTENINLILDAAIVAVENEGKHYVDRVKQLKENSKEILDYACDSKNSEPHAALSHGDLWTYNMLFKYNENSEPKDIRFLDFQLNRYASPVMDILYTFYTCLTQEMRDKYFDKLLHHYHDSLGELLKKFNSDVEKLFPFNVLLEHLQRFGRYGACMSIIDIHVFTIRDEDNAEPLFYLDYLKKLPALLKTNKFYHQMLKDSIKDMVDRNYL
ncbi:uncharacterized protein LOC127286798 [Leptopilina boulardi]|uniref:uncharacterized protein LOC127286798 n=1 Tax=Leptopilina boulardi TaxID=63433 RepID=UPI0021F5C0C9|nr:uncharacterized protein LOC127286798 [Leptopilina boulardi]